MQASANQYGIVKAEKAGPPAYRSNIDLCMAL